jgi:hypothetical protein
MISWIIPYYEVDGGKPAVLKKTVESASGYDELILVWNQGMGYAKSINKGLMLAKGDFLVVSNDDLVFDGSFKDLAYEGAVTSPVVNGVNQRFWGCCFCIPRWVYEEVGGLAEDYEISYFDDDDFQFTLEAHGIPTKCIDKVKVAHDDGGRTLHQMPGWQERFEKNRKVFFDKWGRLP